MMIDLTPVFQALIALIAALITCWLIPWIKAKTTKQQQENLYAAAKIAVYAAEQIFGPKSGQDKFKYARDFLISIGWRPPSRAPSARCPLNGMRSWPT